MMTIREVIVAAFQMLSGLHHIHSKKLIHFDIKPDNILLSNRGEALLSDFGHAKQTNYKGVAPQDRPYTPMIPPEGFKDQEYDVTFDIYQVGLTLYRMCNGNDAFREQLEQYGPKIANREDFRFDVRNAKFPDRKAFAPHVPSKLRKIIRKCLETDPSKRYHSAIEVANALAEIDGPMLGWRLAATPARRVWTKNENGTEYELSVHPDGKSELYKCVNGGARRRVTDGCRASTTDRDLQTLLGSY
jgi:serine/threonine protein kinase